MEFTEACSRGEEHMPDCFDIHPKAPVKKGPKCMVDESEIAIIEYGDSSDVNIQATNTYGDPCYEDIVIAVRDHKVIFARLPVTACPGCTNAMCSMITDLIQTTFGMEYAGKIWVHHIRPSEQRPDGPELLYLGDMKQREDIFKSKFTNKERWHSSWDRYFPGPHHTDDGSKDVVAVVPAPAGSANETRRDTVSLAISIQDTISTNSKPRLRANWND